MGKPHVFKTKDGVCFTFPNEADMKAFALSYALGNLVVEGKMEYATINGHKQPQITALGLQHFKQLTGIEFQ